VILEFRVALKAVDNVSFDIAAGEFVSIVGRPDAGLIPAASAKSSSRRAE
jgi:ABC-type dipeptide/oligopeptide/nickel transport system ATPase component